MNQSADNLGNHLRKARKDRRLTQAEAAAEIGISTKWLGEIERGKAKNLTQETVEAIGSAIQKWEVGSVNTFPKSPVGPNSDRASALEKIIFLRDPAIRLCTPDGDTWAEFDILFVPRLVNTVDVFAEPVPQNIQSKRKWANESMD